MKIFDGVELQQTPSSNAPSWISVAMLIANGFVEAEKHRQERVAREAGSPGTLDEVMAQAGLKIPGIEQALAQLMGGSDEAKQVASMIVGSPEPEKLLQQWAKQFGFPGSAQSTPTGPLVTPPPAQPAPSPEFRPEFTREARQAARAAAAGVGEAEQPSFRPEFTREAGQPSFRPEFTREARQAARAAAAGVGEAEQPSFRPEFTREARQAAGAANSGGSATRHSSADVPASPNVAAPPLVSLVERQLAALRQRMRAYEEVLDVRLARAEAELAALRQELEQRAKPALVVVAAEVETTALEADTSVVDRPSAEKTEVAAGTPHVHDAPEGSSEPAEPLPAVTEDEVVQALGLISAFTEEYEEHHQKGLARVSTIESELLIMRSMVQAGAAATHG
ncbi:hypothetical protein OV090_47950 [Nannocystis sp. RBIL2]|uniref:hypothetical protein n=1 Tax=Nannocystis sp. RBIL2 TaxID=2996788 RepID=UPI002270FF33|nr:hypothetical protein [Nannocystis sp. RBIL2]MCY1072573.1 hypothetical protein [Nannocystis sp. RBIL2]